MENNAYRMAIVVVVALAVALAIVMKAQKREVPTQPESRGEMSAQATVPSATGGPAAKPGRAKAIPQVLDFGRGFCIPCKMMAPILKELQKAYEGRAAIEIIDIGDQPNRAEDYGIRAIPTQIFIDAKGKEVFRHEGFMPKEDIVAKLREMGVNLTTAPGFSRLDPLRPDTRPASSVCYMCDGDVNPRTRVSLKTDKGDVVLCSPHCYFITYSSLLDAKGVEEKAAVTDWSTRKPLTARTAIYLRGIDDSGRPTIKAFADKQAALKERHASGGNILSWQMLQDKELAARCGFCDRAVYPEDAAHVKAGGVHTWGCCPMCALGVAARTQNDIEVQVKDALTGEIVRVKTMNGSVGSLEPKTVVAWAGKKKALDGKVVSAGCFKQAFFASEANLKKWIEQHPTATGRMIAINQALAAKMKLTPQQISKACKIGECRPK